MNKILTIQEALEADIFYLESTVNSNEYGRISGTHGCSVSISRVGQSGWAFEDARDYGSAWRCWDRKPTEAERKAVPMMDKPNNGCWNCMNFDWKHEACTLNWNNLDESYYCPDTDDRDLTDFCYDHEPDPDADPECLEVAKSV